MALGLVLVATAGNASADNPPAQESSGFPPGINCANDDEVLDPGKRTGLSEQAQQGRSYGLITAFP